MIAEALQHRSGRIIALCRIALALLFIFALWLDPAQPVRDSSLGYTLLAGYLVIGIAQLVTAWRNWWADFHLALPAFVLDTLVFLGAVYFTESLHDDFTSPFLAFFAFLMLASTIRWNWRATAWVAAAICSLYFAVGLLMEMSAVEFDIYRFVRRFGYMIVLSLVLIWFGHDRRVTVLPFHPKDQDQGSDPLLLAAAVRYAALVANAKGAAILWEYDEEPESLIVQTGMPGGAPVGVAPGRLGSDHLSDGGSSIFDRRRARQLCRTSAEQLSARRLEQLSPLAAYLDISEGVEVRLPAASGRGQIILYGIPGMCVDDLALSEAIASEIAAKIDNQALTHLAQRAMLNRTREAIARDLHDSVAQSLSAASYRLEALRSWIDAGNDPDPEITSLKQALHREQQHVRGLIAGLRRDNAGEGRSSQFECSDLGADLKRLLIDLASFWRVEAHLDKSGDPNSVPLFYSHEVQQIVREAIANAVRHGGATTINCALHFRADRLHIVLRDNGSGMDVENMPMGPRSIRDRVTDLEGNMHCDAGRDGTTLEIAIPLGMAQ